MKFTITLDILPDTVLKAQSPSVKRPTFASPLIKLRFDTEEHEWVIHKVQKCNSGNNVNQIYFEKCADGDLELTFYFLYYLKTKQGEDFFAPLPLAYCYSNLCLFQQFIGDSRILNEIVLSLVRHIADNRNYLEEQPIDFQDYDQEIKTLFANTFKQPTEHFYLSDKVALQASYFTLFPSALRQNIKKYFPVTLDIPPKNHFLTHRLSDRDIMMAQILAILDHHMPDSSLLKFVGNVIAINDQKHNSEMVSTLKALEFRRILKFHPIRYLRPVLCISIKGDKTKDIDTHQMCDFIMITEINEEKLTRYFRNITASPNNCPSNAYERFTSFLLFHPLDQDITPAKDSRYSWFIKGRDQLEDLPEELHDLEELLRDLLALDNLENAPVTVGDIRPYLDNRRLLLQQVDEPETCTALELVSDLYDAYRAKKFLESHPNLLLNDEPRNGY